MPQVRLHPLFPWPHFYDRAGVAHDGVMGRQGVPLVAGPRGHPHGKDTASPKLQSSDSGSGIWQDLKRLGQSSMSGGFAKPHAVARGCFQSRDGGGPCPAAPIGPGKDLQTGHGPRDRSETIALFWIARAHLPGARLHDDAFRSLVPAQLGLERRRDLVLTLFGLFAGLAIGLARRPESELKTDRVV